MRYIRTPIIIIINDVYLKAAISTSGSPVFSLTFREAGLTV
jgi:hypothetical protein